MFEDIVTHCNTAFCTIGCIEFRSTLEREIGTDEVPPSTNYKQTTTNYSQPPAVDSSELVFLKLFPTEL
jgi:hypothetical protein